ncbi:MULTISPECIES: MoaD/ThiS family protein [Frankiaceae]|uniref:MoaD/ThiS family protein n=1 Tax=Frankiaceae TaxID=74712 RepID=UPI0000544845|nr:MULTISPECIES: MoaD/ThiS family protein [Frankiaceae]ABW15518.1 thiamineS protein [Frankia sp. EAN1pec]TCJ37928.1 MoaD/ThiS family protein [Parafrankia sp. BMG5.11]CAI7976259.1 sulfur-carrier protein [Frankia sp. Hr75.2]SQD97134.1 ThiamineS protein [Parafrankia sp. Ea1.12]
MARIMVRYWAAARDAAGVAQEELDAATLATALADVTERRGERLGAVLARCAFLVDDEPVGRRDPDSVTLREGALIEVLPPFAGG